MFQYGVIPPLMFGALIVFFLIGFPVAFSLAALGLVFGVLGILTGHFEEVFLQALPYRLFGIVSNELLLAIPFFTFMGAILERCGLAEDLLEGTGQLFGKIPGGLAYAVILVGAVLGAITGTVAASVIAMAVIALPVMKRYGYDMKLATGVIAASGTITQLIPPSLVLIVLAEQLGRVGRRACISARPAPRSCRFSSSCLRRRAVARSARHDAAAAAGSAHRTRAGAARSRWRRAWCPRSSSSSSSSAPSPSASPRRPRPAPWAPSARWRSPRSTAA